MLNVKNCNLDCNFGLFENNCFDLFGNGNGYNSNGNDYGNDCRISNSGCIGNNSDNCIIDNNNDHNANHVVETKCEKVLKDYQRKTIDDITDYLECQICEETKINKKQVEAYSSYRIIMEKAICNFKNSVNLSSGILVIKKNSLDEAYFVFKKEVKKAVKILLEAGIDLKNFKKEIYSRYCKKRKLYDAKYYFQHYLDKNYGSYGGSEFVECGEEKKDEGATVKFNRFIFLRNNCLKGYIDIKNGIFIQKTHAYYHRNNSYYYNLYYGCNNNSRQSDNFSRDKRAIYFLTEETTEELKKVFIDKTHVPIKNISLELLTFENMIYPNQQLKLSKNKRVLMVLPTGSGKTYAINNFLLENMGKYNNIAYLVYKDDLLLQTAINMNELNLIPAVMKNKKSLCDKSFTKTKVIDENTNIDLFNIQVNLDNVIKQYDLIIIDECHKTNAKSYKAFLTKNITAKVIGMTATPFRLDGELLSDIYSKYIENLSFIDFYKKYSPLISYKIFNNINYSKSLKKTSKDIELSDSVKYVDNDLKEIIAKIKEQTAEQQKQYLIFVNSVTQANNVSDILQNNNFNSKVLTGEQKPQETINLIRDFKDKKINILVSVEKMIYGTDIPAVDVIILCRPTRSPNVYLQMIGRLTRLESTFKIKEVWDCCNNFAIMKELQKFTLFFKDRDYKLLFDFGLEYTNDGKRRDYNVYTATDKSENYLHLLEDVMSYKDIILDKKVKCNLLTPNGIDARYKNIFKDAFKSNNSYSIFYYMRNSFREFVESIVDIKFHKNLKSSYGRAFEKLKRVKILLNDLDLSKINKEAKNKFLNEIKNYKKLLPDAKRQLQTFLYFKNIVDNQKRGATMDDKEANHMETKTMTEIKETKIKMGTEVKTKTEEVEVGIETKEIETETKDKIETEEIEIEIETEAKEKINEVFVKNAISTSNVNPINQYIKTTGKSYLVIKNRLKRHLAKIIEKEQAKIKYLERRDKREKEEKNKKDKMEEETIKRKLEEEKTIIFKQQEAIKTLIENSSNIVDFDIVKSKQDELIELLKNQYDFCVDG